MGRTDVRRAVREVSQAFTDDRCHSKLSILFGDDSLDVSNVERRSSGGGAFLSTRADVGLVVLTVLVRIGRYICEIQNSKMKEVWIRKWSFTPERRM